MCQVVADKRLKTMEHHFKLSGPKRVVAVAYRRWSFTGGANCKALTRKVLVFWNKAINRLWEVVAYERESLHGGSTVL